MEQGLQVAHAGADDSEIAARDLQGDQRPRAARARVLQGERGRVLGRARSSPTRSSTAARAGTSRRFDPAKRRRAPLPPRPGVAPSSPRSASRRVPTSTPPPTSTAGCAPARSPPRACARVWISPERARWAREQRRVVGEWDDGSIAVELSFAGVDWLVREVLKEAGDAAVLEPRRRARAVRARGAPSGPGERPRADPDERRGGRGVPRGGADRRSARRTAATAGRT